MSSNKRSSNNDHNDQSTESTPYRFLDTSEIPSYDKPHMIKAFLRPCQDLPRRFFPAIRRAYASSSSSIAFLKDEKFLLFGTNSGVTSQGKTEFLEGHSPLCIIDLKSGVSKKLNDVNVAVGDINVSCKTGRVVFLTYDEGYRHLQLWQFNGTSNLYSVDKCKPVELSRYLVSPSCSISPNGKWIVIAACLSVYTVDQNKLHHQHEVLIPDEAYQLISVEFSQDSNFFAVGTCAPTNGKVLLLSTETWQVITEIGNMEHNFHVIIWGAFNPLSMRRQLLSLTDRGFLEKWDTCPLYNNQSQQLDRIDHMFTSKTDPSLLVASCPKFSPDGNMFAVPCNDASIIIIDPNLFEKLWIISCPEFQFEFQRAQQMNINMGKELQARSVCFSKSCEYLAVGYAGCVVSVWLLPRIHFTLQHFCRTKIISICPPNLVHELPIPSGLKKYLLYQNL